jgi:plastocyanin
MRFNLRNGTLAATVVICGSALAAAPAVAQAPAEAKLRIVGGTQMKPGKFIRDDQRFAPRKLRVRAGGKVRLANKAKTEDPHTLSVVKRSDLPKTAAQALGCEVCGPFFGAHGVDEESGDVANPVVNVGGAGFDQPGDSIFVPPGATVRFDVGEAEGKTLYYLCAVHPWMQGKLRVR